MINPSMFEIYLQHQKVDKSRHKAQQNDFVLDLLHGLGKAFYFFFINPYKGLKRRLENRHFHLWAILILNLIAVPVYFLLFDETVMRFIFFHNLHRIFSPILISSRGFLFMYLVTHAYIFLIRLPALRNENIYNRKFNELGLVPSYKSKPIVYIDDYALKHDQRRLVLLNPGLPLSVYESKREEIEATCDFQITHISFGKSFKYVRVDYRTKAFPKIIAYKTFTDSSEKKSHEFNVGLALNGKKITCTLKRMIHLLVAGETGGGKSTFLRQFIVDCLNSKDPIHLHLIDLKGGVEFQPFSDFKSVTLIKEFSETATVLENLNSVLDKRLKVLEKNKVNDIEAFEDKSKEKHPRIVLIIDECAEIFLKSNSQDSATKTTLNDIRFNLGRLARLSRAVGIHLVLATQRADKGAIDMQTKDNLVSRLCFRVNNDYASQMVLRDGRAAKLPKVQGRAIWKEGNDEYEVQVPYLDQKEIQEVVNGTTTSD